MPKTLEPMNYLSIRDIICPNIEWVNKITLEEGREEVNAILDVLIELSKLAKSKTKQISEANKLKKIFNTCKIQTNKNKGNTSARLKALEEMWEDIQNKVDKMGYYSEYDKETDRILLCKKELMNIQEQFDTSY